MAACEIDRPEPGWVAPRGRAASYLEALFRYVHDSPGGIVEDTRLGVTRLIGDRQVVPGMNPKSVSAAVSILERKGRIVSEWGHRSLDNSLCRIRLMAIAEPVPGYATPPAEPVETPEPEPEPGPAGGSPLILVPTPDPALLSEMAEHTRHLLADIEERDSMIADLFDELDFAGAYIAECEAELAARDGGTAEAILEAAVEDSRRFETSLRWQQRRIARRDERIASLSAARDAAAARIEALTVEIDAERAARSVAEDRLSLSEQAVADLKASSAAAAAAFEDAGRRLELVRQRLLAVVVTALSETGSETMFASIQGLMESPSPVESLVTGHSKVVLRDLCRVAELDDRPRVDWSTAEFALPTFLPRVDEGDLSPRRGIARHASDLFGRNFRQVAQFMLWLTSAAGAAPEVRYVPRASWPGTRAFRFVTPEQVTWDGKGLHAGGRTLRSFMHSGLRTGDGEPLGEGDGRLLYVVTADSATAKALFPAGADRRGLIVMLDDGEGVAVHIARSELDRAVPQKDVDSLLAAPGRLGGLLDVSSDSVAAWVGAALLFAGWHKAVGEESSRRVRLGEGWLADADAEVLFADITDDVLEDMASGNVRWQVRSAETVHWDGVVSYHVAGREVLAIAVRTRLGDI